MKNSKIKSLKKLQKICVKLRKEGKTIGLITGCFDVLHVGHVAFLKFAKSKVDFLVVGLDNDKTIKISKSQGRPIYGYSQRAEVLSELQSVDFVFQITATIDFGSPKAETVYVNISRKINPTAIFAVPLVDKYWINKRNRAKKLGVLFYEMKKIARTSSTDIIKKLEL